MVDYNKIQALSRLRDALPLENLSSKFKAFNWNTIEIKDGHSFDELIPILQLDNKKHNPRVVIVNTIKGKGVKAFENDPAWHARKIKDKELELGKRELGII